MSKLIAMGVIILNLAFFSQCGTTQAITGTQATLQGNSTEKEQNASSRSSEERKVVNIVVDKIENGVIYSKDSQTFNIPSSAEVIDNSHSVTKMRTAELVFEDGRLVTVSIK